MILELLATGAPTVDKAGPSFPAELTKIMPCFTMASLIISPIRLKFNFIIISFIYQNISLQ